MLITRKFCWIFFKKREISIVHLTNYINMNGSKNHANNHNHLDYYRNSLAILFNLVLDRSNCDHPCWRRDHTYLPLSTLIQIAITPIQGKWLNFIHPNKLLHLSKLLYGNMLTNFQSFFRQISIMLKLWELLSWLT